MPATFYEVLVSLCRMRRVHPLPVHRDVLIPSFSSLPAESRYITIRNLTDSMCLTPRNAAERFGKSESTVRKALAWCESPVPVGHQGRLKLLGPNMVQHIAERTVADRRLTNARLAEEIPTHFRNDAV
jgi:hypothetical protein